MRIGIVGSWKPNKPGFSLRGDEAGFRKACGLIGEELARKSLGILVGSHRQATADKHVVDGYVRIAATQQPREPAPIEVLRPQRDDDVFQDLQDEHPWLFSYPYEEAEAWQPVRLRFAARVDTTLAIGGSGGTYLAGLATLLTQKRLVPIGCFGGAAGALQRELPGSVNPEFANRLAALNGRWTAHLAQVAITALGVLDPPRVLLIHGHSDDWLELQKWLEEDSDLADPVVMVQDFAAGQTLPAKFEKLASECDAAIALATPDDLGRASAKDGSEKSRARQNVWLEVGWFWGRLGRSRVLTLVKGDVDRIEIPSDLQGVENYSYERSPLERRSQIERFLGSIKRHPR